MNQQPVKPRRAGSGSKAHVLQSRSVIPNHVAGVEAPSPLISVCVRKAPAADFKSDNRQKEGGGGGRKGILVMQVPRDDSYFISHDEAERALTDPTAIRNFNIHNEAFFVNEIPHADIIGFIKSSYVGVADDMKEVSKQRRGGDDEETKINTLRDAKLKEIGRAMKDKQAKKIIDDCTADITAAMYNLGLDDFKEAVKGGKKLPEDAIPEVWAHLEKKAEQAP